ncbi:unnamed protein product [Polarella glacialis]|uniref:Pseudouridine synthase RsuA/RluA-like domain-containing protein n=1 Tax=Polarella glacialis TaxID=89957 RepID=A0A813LL28_POLGL|nr:unnamed protein product [Polarella glacialis]CAE8696674.1 unnamed protein product [Polarella glacialis]CAE8733961.1 unnamed protein product [Polarella glacialis]
MHWAARQLAEGRVFVDGLRCGSGLAGLVGSEQVVSVRPDSGPELELPVVKEFYLKFFKPRGVITSHSMEKLSARPVISACYPTGAPQSLHFAGRLDRDSEGLVLLTTDGLLSYFATTPGAHLDKEYMVVTSCQRDGRPPSEDSLQMLRDGVELYDGLARAQEAEVVDFDGRFARLRIVVSEGRFRMVRRMLRSVGYCVMQLLRTKASGVQGVQLPSMQEAVKDHSLHKRAGFTIQAAPALLAKDTSCLQPGEFAPLSPPEVNNIYNKGLRMWEAAGKKDDF